MANVVRNMRDLLPDDQRGDGALRRMENYLRANIHPDRHPNELAVKSVMPGDADFESHPLYVPPNKYTKHGFAILKRAWDTGRVPNSEREEVKTALLILADGQVWDNSAFPCTAEDQTEVRWYSGKECDGDDEIFDPSATRGPSNFVRSIQHSDDTVYKD